MGVNPASPKFDITPGEPIPAALAEAELLLTDTLAEVGCVVIKRSTLDGLLAEVTGLRDEIEDRKRELTSAGRSYMRDVEARDREIVRLKKLLTEAGVSWNP